METLFKIEKPVEQDVHILSTSIATMYDVNRVAWYFDSHEKIRRWSIDLQDWEKVLKLSVIDGFDMLELERFLNSKGYVANELND
ncbi:MAG: hypothetical protein ABJP45_04095 [Cyclobacteriaceae bacterium]